MDKLIQLYKSANGAEKNKIIHDLCDICYAPIATVQGWVRGYHKPTQPTINLINKYVENYGEKDE